MCLSLPFQSALGLCQSSICLRALEWLFTRKETCDQVSRAGAVGYMQLLTSLGDACSSTFACSFQWPHGTDAILSSREHQRCLCYFRLL